MNTLVEELFHQVVDLPPDTRSRFFGERGIDDETRRQVEALLAFEPGASAFLERDIGVAAARALPQLEALGRHCGPYRLKHILGRGGMGTVYFAERVDGEVSQNVAVKLLPPGAGGLQRERFLQERQILASLSHPNIARLLDAGHLEHGEHGEDEQPFLAMEYIEGQPIDAFAAPLSGSHTIAVFLKVCAAVAYLHQHLIIHRDLKPSNILVTADGEPKLLDFGIAKLLDLATDTTATAMRAMTPDYASPEQVTGKGLTTTSDIYSLGAVLYLLLTGKPAHEFAGVAPEAMLSVVTSREVTRPSRWVPALKGDLELILLKALRKDPHARYQTVEQFADDLRRYLRSEPVTARAGSYVYRARKFVVRHRSGLIAAATAAGALIAGTGIAVRQARESARQRDVALAELRRAEATNDFSSFLLAEATPAAGKPISNAELLARGEALIAKQFAGDAALRVHMLLTLADRYQENQQFPDRTRVLERAYAESQSLDDIGLRAEAACQWASQLAERGDFAQSFRLLDDVLASLSVRPEYAAVEAACRVTESLGASQAMDPARAQRAAERALALEERRGGIRAIRSDALSALASAYKNASQFDDANRVNEQLVALYEAEGRENTRDMTTVLNNWAVMLGDAGQMLHAASVAGRAVDIARTLDSEHGASLTLLTNDAAALAAVGRNDEANRLFDEALAKGRVAGSPRRHIATLSLAINAACEAGDSSRAERLLSESYATLKADPSASTYMKGVVDMDAAAVALTRGALPRAVELASGALTTLEAATPNKASAGAAEQTLAHALNAAGRYREALPIAERRASTARSRLGGYRYSYRLGKALVEEAYARAGLGDAAVAGNTVAAAIEHLSATAGPESRALQRAMALQRQLSGQ